MLARYPVNVKLLTLLLLGLLSQAATLTLRNVNIVDADSGTIRKNRDVTITGSVITSVSEAHAARAGLSSGRYLIPGLWDMHVHLWDSKPRLGRYVVNGVLGVRDMGSDLARTKALRADIEAGRLAGPRIFTSGSPVNGPGADNPKMQIARAGGPDNARRMVDALDAQGVDFIDVLSTLPKDAYFALAQRARVIRAVFAGHVPDSVTVLQAIDARQKSMEHLFGIALACSSEEPELRDARYLAVDSKDTAELARIRARTYETFSETRAIELFRKMARYDVWQTPTLTLRKRIAPEDYDFHARLVNMMQRYGVGLLAGTDTGEDGVHPGEALHEELELLVQSGLTPAQALRTATYNPAQYFGIEAQSGSIARGKRADLVLLSANPLEDIRNTRKIDAVILRGRLLDHKQLAKESDAWPHETSLSSKQPPVRSSVKRQGSSRKRASRTR
jgi:imidazolonepropionase-like amidohydrolase